MSTKLTIEEREILYHTLHCLARKAYCGDSPAMQSLVSAGYMRSIGRNSLCPDEYFTITDAGRSALKEAAHG